MNERYNPPDITSLQFLREAMHDRTLPLRLRIAAAKELLPYEYAQPAPVRVIPDAMSEVQGLA
jgi:hypothetical protein